MDSKRKTKEKSWVTVAVIAFCVGAAACWLIVTLLNDGGQPAAQTQPPTYVVSRTFATAEVTPTPVPDSLQESPGLTEVSLGNADYDQKNWVKAAEHYRLALSWGTDNADVRTDLGNALRFAGEPRKALEQYQMAQRKDLHHENSLYNMATLYARELKDPAAAVQTMQEYLVRFPNGDKAAAVREFIQESASSEIKK